MTFLEDMNACASDALGQMEAGKLGAARSSLQALLDTVRERIADAESDALPTIVVEIEEGLISTITSTIPVRVLAIDHDTEGCDPADLRAVPMGFGDGTELAWFSERDVVVVEGGPDAERVAALVALADQDATVP